MSGCFEQQSPYEREREGGNKEEERKSEKPKKAKEIF